MIDYGRIRSTVKPKSIVIDEYSVWVNTDIQEVEVTMEGDTHTEYEFNQVQYTKDEYILVLNSELTNTQLALCEVYEILLGGE